MAYSGACSCGAIKFSFEYDPMLHFQCHCSNCHKVFGTSINALAMPEHELEIDFKLTKGTHSKHACFSPTVICAAYETDNSTENSKEHEFKVESIGTWSPIKLISKSIFF